MNPKCAKCEKTVYPLEKLNCLDKFWHKACFKCWECGMTLNMKNYKGYDKKPYCNAHYPSMKHTQVAETPEMARIAQNTKLQSNVQYHKEFEEGKGKYTAVGTDDPEMSRLLKNQKKVSSVEYHKDFEEAKGKYTGVGTEDPEIARLLKNQQKISTVQYHKDFEETKGKYTTVGTEDPEIARLLKNQQRVSSVVYHDEFEKARGKHTQVADDPETIRHLRNMQNISSVTYHKRFEEDKGKYTTVTDSRELRRLLESQETVSLIKYHEDFEKNIKGTKIQVADDPETARIRQNMATISQVEYKGLRKQHDNMESQRGNIGKDVPHHHQPAEPIMRQRSNEEARPSPYSSRSSGSSTVYTHSGEVEAASQPRRVGSIADYDPMNDNFGSLTQKPPGSYSGAQWQETVSAPQAPPPQQQPEPQAYRQPPPPADPVPPPSSYNQPPPPQQAPPKAAGMVRKALYDYTAGDDDEVSFQENDLIINCEPIDEGWMFGTNERTGQRGMLPANYVGPV